MAHKPPAIGSCFTTSTAVIAPADSIKFDGPGAAARTGTVVSVGGDFMVVKIEDAAFECRRWKAGDPAIQKAKGHTAWTIYGLVGHTAP